MKSPPAVQETQVRSLGWEDSWGRKWLPTPVFLPGEFHRQRSLEGYSPWGHIESGTTEQETQTYKETEHKWLGRQHKGNPPIRTGKRKKKKGNNLGYLLENSRYTNIHIIGVPEEEREICVENVIWLNCGLKMSESVLYICVSFSVLHIGLSLPSF